jgi:hypothetical protein
MSDMEVLLITTSVAAESFFEASASLIHALQALLPWSILMRHTHAGGLDPDPDLVEPAQS